MKKSIVTKVIFNILFVVCSLWFLINCYKLLDNGTNIYGILSNKNYTESDGNRDNFYQYSGMLIEFIDFQESYCVDNKLDTSKMVTDKYDIKDVFENFSYNQISNSYLGTSYNEDTYDNSYIESGKVYKINGIKLTYDEVESIYNFYSAYETYQTYLVTLNGQNTNYKFYVQWTDINDKEHIYSNTSVEDMDAKYNGYSILWSKDNSNNTDGVSIPTEKSNGMKLTNYYLEEIKNMVLRNRGFSDKSYKIMLAVDTEYPIADRFQEDQLNYEDSQRWMAVYFKSFLISIIGMLVLLSFMIVGAGNKKGYDGVYLNWFDKWYTEFGFIVTMIGIIIPISMLPVRYVEHISVYPYTLGSIVTQYNTFDMIVIIILLTFSIQMAVFGFLSLIRRIKAGTVIKNSLISTVFCSIKNAITPRGKNVKLGAHTLVAFIFYLAVNLFLFMITVPSGEIVVFLFLECIVQLVTLVIILKFFEGYSEVYNGSNEIAKGNLDYKINENISGNMNREIARSINNIGAGLEDAVESSLKNERLKTDLITNVSHDIKTPLTSIMNYVELLKREYIDNEKAAGYIKVLEDKAARLKNLTEDLVEASKLSSGVVKLNVTNINIIELVNQVNGEFEEKFEAKELMLVCNVPDEPVTMMGDGRRIWRILENIYNNAFKYSLAGTRVYVDVISDNAKVRISVKNVSENPLNFDASELTERFIRGDVSRNTEGSGLGLSIVQSLVDLHGGRLDIQLDGDLFKVVIEFDEKRFT